MTGELAKSIVEASNKFDNITKQPKCKSNKTTQFTPKQKRQKEFLSEYFKTLGHISDACKKADIARKTYYLWMKEDLEFQEKFNELTESFDDGIETGIRKIADSGDKDMMKFWAKTKMKRRDFTERTEQTIEHKGEGFKLVIESPEE